MNYGLCDRCYGIVYYLFDRSRYQPGTPSRLVQRFHFLDDYRQIPSMPDDCKLCSLVKEHISRKEDWVDGDEASWPSETKTWPSLALQATGGNTFRPASRESGLQLRQIKIDMAYGGGRHDTPFSLILSITSAKGTTYHSIRALLLSLDRKSRDRCRRRVWDQSTIKLTGFGCTGHTQGLVE